MTSLPITLDCTHNKKMCVQFMSSKSLNGLAEEFSAEIEVPFAWKPHVFPKYQSPVIVRQNGKKIITSMAFGLIPFFEKDLKPKMVFHNARIETVSEKVSFKKAYAESRCLIPLDSFFEYVPDVDGKKRLVQFIPKLNTTLLAAGIWSTWNSPDGNKLNCFSMITSNPPDIIKKTGHDRCPMFLTIENSNRWLESVNESFKTQITEELLNFEFNLHYV